MFTGCFWCVFEQNCVHCALRSIILHQDGFFAAGATQTSRTNCWLQQQEQLKLHCVSKGLHMETNWQLAELSAAPSVQLKLMQTTAHCRNVNPSHQKVYLLRRQQLWQNVNFGMRTDSNQIPARRYSNIPTVGQKEKVRCWVSERRDSCDGPQMSRQCVPKISQKTSTWWPEEPDWVRTSEQVRDVLRTQTSKV